jgi:Asp-tRNA(Asn)/Glu-tRNA(Gln) amidotransferase B subunit
MYDLKDHAYWIIISRKVHSELLARFENVKEIVEEFEESNIVDIVEEVEENNIVDIVEEISIVEIVEENSIVEIVEENSIVEIVEENSIVEIVEIVEENSIVEKQEKLRVITTGYFYCDDCKWRLKRTEFNSHHTKCRICYYPNKDRGKCLISLDM